MRHLFYATIEFDSLELKNNPTKEAIRALYNAKRTQALNAMDDTFDEDFSILLEEAKRCQSSK